MKSKMVLTLIIFSMTALGVNRPAAQTAQRTDRPPIAGMATLSGNVDAPKPFQAAQVFILNTDKQIAYTVFTSGGAFKAVALYPGNYEVNAQARGFESAVQKLTIAAGEHPTLKISMRQSADPNHIPSSVRDTPTFASESGSVQDRKLPILQSYDEIYPPGRGKDVAEKVCMVCHGENWLPGLPATEEVWQTRLDYMMGKTLFDRDRTGLGQGALAPPAQTFYFGAQDRKDLLEYLVKNFGPESQVRAVRTTQPVPMDEAVLGKAQFIEYYLSKPQANPDGRAAIRYIQLDGKGNAWMVNSQVPNQLVKLDPRTATQTNYPVPIPDRGLHDFVIARDGIIWVANFGTKPGIQPMLYRFNPDTEEWKTFDPDPDNQIRTTAKSGMVGLTVDSKGTIWASWMTPGVISELDPKTGKATIYRIPTDHSSPYGLYCDQDDNLWWDEWTGGKIGKFDTTNKSFTEYTPPTYPASMRRSPTSDSKGNIWGEIWQAGKRPGKILKLDSRTGRWTEWPIPMQGAQPYESTVDRDDNIWFPTDWDRSDQPAVIGRFNPVDQTFRFYPKPKPQASHDKLVHADDGSVWYSACTPTCNVPGVGFGVLYPDKDKITTLAAFALNGPPSYAYKLSRSTAKSATKPSKGDKGDKTVSQAR